MKEQLTQQELQMLANIVAQFVAPMGQALPYIDLINKLSRMIDQLRLPALTKTKMEE